MVYYVNDTIRLTGTFYTWAGVLSDPTSVTVNIYDVTRTKLVTAATPTHSGTGVYYYDYTPTVEGKHTIEFTGTLEGKAIVMRKYVTIVWQSA